MFQVESPPAAPCQNVASERRTQLVWFLQGSAVAVLMLLGVAACGGLPIASDASAELSPRVPTQAFNPMPALRPVSGQGKFSAVQKQNPISALTVSSSARLSPMIRFAASNPYLRVPPLSMGATEGESVPTGLVWPSADAVAKTREEGGIRMYSTHAWKDDMSPILPALNSLKNDPVMIGVAADSGCGKSTFLKRIMGALGTDVTPGHTAIGDTMTVVCLDDYHINDRAGRKATGLTALDAAENDFDLMGAQLQALREQKAVYKPIYNHDTGFKDPPELIQPNKVMIFEGLHPIYDKTARAALDMGIYIDIVNDVKFAWKVQRDVTERGWTEEQVKQDIEKRLPDFAKFVDPQKANADVVLRYEPSDKGLPLLKVKLIQKKGGAFPMVTLKKSLSLGSAELKMYDDDWFGNKVTVVEMDGELDMSKYKEQLTEIEKAFEGLDGKTATEFSEAMVKLKDSPGAENGTGLLQTVIAMKVRQVYEQLTSKSKGGKSAAKFVGTAEEEAQMAEKVAYLEKRAEVAARR